MTEQVQYSACLKYISRDLKIILWIAQKVFSMYLEENHRWVPFKLGVAVTEI